jgi:hypothetical protein
MNDFDKLLVKAATSSLLKIFNEMTMQALNYFLDISGVCQDVDAFSEVIAKLFGKGFDKSKLEDEMKKVILEALGLNTKIPPNKSMDQLALKELVAICKANLAKNP